MGCCVDLLQEGITGQLTTAAGGIVRMDLGMDESSARYVLLMIGLVKIRDRTLWRIF